MNKGTRSNLSAAMQRVSAPHGGKRASPAPSPDPEGTADEAKRKKLTVYLDPSVYRKLRQLAFDRDSNMNEIVGGLIAGELRGARS